MRPELRAAALLAPLAHWAPVRQAVDEIAGQLDVDERTSGHIFRGNDADFLRWIADRQVNVHGDNPNLDYLHRLREIADALDVDDDVHEPSYLRGWNACRAEPLAKLGLISERHVP